MCVFSELKCDQCNATFVSKAKLTAHKKRHIQIKHKDDHSGTINSEAKKLKKRMETDEIITPDIPYKRAKQNEIHEVDEEEGDQLAESLKHNEYHITYQDDSNVEATIVLKQEKDQMINFDDAELTEKVRQLLDLLVDDDTLAEFGWPEKSVEDVLSLVIEQCDQVPADYATCPDYATKIRENTKLLFTTVIDNDSIKELLNNQTIDEVILHVLKTAG